MEESLQAIIRELKVLLRGKAVGGEQPLDDEHGKGFVLSLLGRAGANGWYQGRAVAVEFRSSGDLEIDVATEARAWLRIQRNTFLARLMSMFGRRLETGDPGFDDEWLVKELGGRELASTVALPEFRELVTRLAPFQVIHLKGRILEAIFGLYPETLRTVDVMSMIADLDRLAELFEPAPAEAPEPA